MKNAHVLLGVLHQTPLHYENLQIDPLGADAVDFSVKMTRAKARTNLNLNYLGLIFLSLSNLKS